MVAKTVVSLASVTNMNGVLENVEQARARMSMRRTALLFALVAGMSAWAGCSSTTGEAAGVAEADFVAAYAEIVCIGNEKCCASAQYPVNHSACVAKVQGDTLPSTSQKYNATNATECLSWIQKDLADSCVVEPQRPLGDDRSYFCKNVYPGTKKLGDVCIKSDDCAPSREGDAICAGTCELIRFAHEGDDCSVKAAAPANCGYWGFSCSVDGKCQPYRKPGEACDSVANCEFNTCVDGTCPPLGRLGEPCNSGLSIACATDATCPTALSVCTAKKLTGETCTPGDVCRDGVCSLGRCSAGITATAEFCAGTTAPAVPPPVPMGG
jgi:hypothetical protein